MNRKIITASIATLALGLSIGLSACGGNSNANQQESGQQQTDSSNLEHGQPLPLVTWSQARENLIDIELAQVNDVQTTTFVMAYADKDPINSCPSVGFGLPDSASLSNPDQVVGGPNSSGGNVIGQEDPTGYYAPTSSAGTYIICLTATGQPYIDRFESNVDTIGGNATWDYTLHRSQLVGAPTATAREGKK
jgi:hypothetical protein